MTSRRHAILSFVLGSSEPVNVAELARRFDVSPRTIRYDLSRIDSWLHSRGGRLKREPRGAIVLQPPPAPADSATPAASLCEYALSASERRDLILAALITAGPLTSAQIARRLGVSRNTVLKDIDEVESGLVDRGIRLARVRGKGFLLDAPEENLRSLAVDILARATHGQTLWGQGQRAASSPATLISPRTAAYTEPLLRLVDSRGLDAVFYAVSSSCRACDLMLDMADMSSIVWWVAVALKRVRQGRTVAAGGTQDAPLEGTREWKTAEAIAEALRRRRGIALPPPEVQRLAEELSKARRSRCLPPDGYPPVDPATARRTARFIEVAGAMLGVRLTGDKELFVGLSMHLAPIEERLRLAIRLRNPLLQDIKSKYPGLFFVAGQCSALLEEELGLPIPDDEVGYLAMYLGAALERRRSRVKKIRLILVCGNGVGAAQLLASTVAANIPEADIVGTASQFDVLSRLLRADPVDCVVSTVPLPPLAVPVIPVPPIMDDQDIRRLRARLLEGRPETLETQDSRPPGPAGLSTARPAPGLAAALPPSRIRLDVPCRTREEAVREAGRLLVKAGLVLPPYVDRMAHLLETLGPYIVVAPGVALPHARPEGDVSAMGLSMVRLREPVEFGSAVNDPVDLVFALCSTDLVSHLQALTQLAGLVNTRPRLDRLRKAPSPEHAAAILAGTDRTQDGPSKGVDG